MSKSPRARFPGWSGSKSDDARQRRRANHLYWAAIAGLALTLVATIAAVAGVLPLVSSGTDAEGTSGRAGPITLEQVVLRNGPDEYSTRRDGRITQTVETMPTIDLTLLNRGTRRVLISEARLRIADYAYLPACVAQGGGDVPVSGAYAIELPADPQGAERTVVEPLHQQIGPDAVDRIVLRFGLPERLGEGSSLYVLRLRLTLSDGDPVDVGRFLIATPAPVERNGISLPEDQTVLTGDTIRGALTLRWTWCYRRNLAQLRRLLALPGRRSPEVAVLQHVVLAPAWAAAQDDTQPRAAALALLHDANSPEPQLAVFAAEQTGDAAFVERVRSEGARALLATAQRDLDEDFPAGAVQAAQDAQHLAPSAAGSRLLAEAERRAAAAAAP